MKDLLSWGTYRHIKDQGDAPRFNTVNGANEETREVGVRRQRRSVDFDSELSGGREKGKTEERLRGVYRNKP
jgi:hypothetical protein